MLVENVKKRLLQLFDSILVLEIASVGIHDEQRVVDGDFGIGQLERTRLHAQIEHLAHERAQRQ